MNQIRIQKIHGFLTRIFQFQTFVVYFKKMNTERMESQMWWLRKPQIISDVENNQACQAAKKFVSRLYNEDARIDVSL